MKYKTLRVESMNGIGIIWMNRPELRNAFNETMIAELTAAFRALDEDAAIRVVVLAGAGAAFCAGADLNWMQRMAGYGFEQNHADAMNFARMMHTINTMGKPTIARVHGAAFAGGVGLVAACDMAVATYDAEFCLSEVRLGLLPATIGPYVMRAMGERAARRYFQTGEKFAAAEAYRLGLLSEIAPPEELDARINELLGQLIQGGPNAQKLSKEWIRTAAGAPITPDLIKDSATRIAAARAAKEGREGIASFLEKRKPSWIAGQKKTAAKKATSPKSKTKARK